MDMRRRDFISLIGGATIGWPLAARAQHAMPVIGFLSGQSPTEFAPYMAAFQQGLKEDGFVEGQNVKIEYRWAEGQYDRLPALAADLVRREVAVIAATGGTVSVLAAKAATTTIPIVFTTGADPVKIGLVTNLNRPSGSITGASFFTNPLAAKRLELLREFVPNATLIAFLVNPNSPNAGPDVTEAQDAARSLGLQLLVVRAGTERELAGAFATLVEQRAGALLVAADAFFISRRDQLVELAARHMVPAIYFANEFAEAGGLTSYGLSQTDVYRQAGVYAGHILKGAVPADLPVVLPTKYEFVINMKTAKTLGLTFPIPLLGRADKVIE
jgi:putative tryptophan/tyrosine transport system substrate-binding protein